MLVKLSNRVQAPPTKLQPKRRLNNRTHGCEKTSSDFSRSSPEEAHRVRGRTFVENADEGEERIAYRASLNDAISTFSSAADRGQQALFAEANILIKNLLAAREVRILVHSGGAWRDWDLLMNDDLLLDIKPVREADRMGRRDPSGSFRLCVR